MSKNTKDTKNKFVTTEMILAKKGLLDKAPDPFYSEFFGGEIEVENTHGESFAEMLSHEIKDEHYANSRLLYENCPMFRDPKLLEEYEVEDPYLLPKKIYGANVVEFLQLGKYILALYGHGSVDDIKKK
jgi:hypothetical protein